MKNIEPTRLRCPHCREMIDIKVESKVKVAVRKPFTLDERKTHSVGSIGRAEV